ncbi:MAG: bifunctional diaminohydroxyphosphoribosylaminopyrimidine deaminase/5-amino-6-(5-phosphoribosylamino)uracil reductase RibD [Chitinophagaceae bacterium]
MRDEVYMRRCFELAGMALGEVAPNPIVGAVLVHEERIIGEGYHRQYGAAHAEVNAIGSVQENDRPLIPYSTMYVSLEPCAHFGKTPPCADLLIRERVKKVVIANRDPFPDVDGKGIGKLTAAGIEVSTGLLEAEGWWLNRRFFTFHTKQRPYIVLKWAQTSNGIIGTPGERLLISNPFTNRLVHKWRSEEAAILVGKNTALQDNPRLDNRYWKGAPPVRVLLDTSLAVPATAHIYNNTAPSIIINYRQEKTAGNITWLRADVSRPLATEVCRILYEQKIQSVLIEGGAKTLSSFLEADLFDEVRVITNENLTAGSGIKAPLPGKLEHLETVHIGSDAVTIFRRP